MTALLEYVTALLEYLSFSLQGMHRPNSAGLFPPPILSIFLIILDLSACTVQLS